MKKVLSGLTIVAVALVSVYAHAIAQNLPHHNRSDVDSAVKLFIPYTDFSIINDAAVGTGDPVVQEVNSLGLAAIRMEATSDDAHVLVPIPDNMCVDCPVKISVLWSTDSVNTSNTVTWKVLYKAIANDEAVTSASTDLDTTISSDTVDNAAYGLQETPQGVISAATLSRGDILHILTELDATSGLNPASSVVFLHGIYFEYVRQQL